MSEVYQSQSHSKWNCKYHVVFVPKGRRKVLFGQARRHLGTIFHALAQQKECRIIEDQRYLAVARSVQRKPRLARTPQQMGFARTLERTARGSVA